jgi:hypothetical protein
MPGPGRCFTVLRRTVFQTLLIVALCGAAPGIAQQPAIDRFAPGGHPLNTWVKLSPLPDGPPSPRLGYEGACAWDSKRGVLIRYGGHNPGGGGEQGSEIWSFDPRTGRWILHEPNTSPPGICCGQQNVFDPVAGLYIRFPAFSASHGWQWRREVWLNDSSVWTYDLASNTWRNMRPLPTAHPRPLRCAAWDSDHQIVVIFGGEGSSEGTQVYDPYTNQWTAMRPPAEPAFRSGGNMVYDSHQRVFVLFGAQFTDDPHTWIYDVRANRWRDAAPAEMPPTDRNDAVLAYDSHARKVVALIKIGGQEESSQPARLETWTYDVAANRWQKMNPLREPDPSGNRARQLMFAPELNVVLLENRPHPPHGPAEQQIWSYRLVEVGAQNLLPPHSLSLTTTEEGVQLSWQAPSQPDIRAYRILRGAAQFPWQADLQPIAEVPADSRQYLDRINNRGLPDGQVYFYAVVAVAADGRVSTPSILARTQPGLVTDLVVSVLAPQQIELRWQAPAGEDVTGYIVERAVVEVWSDDQLVALKKRTPPLEPPSAGAIRRIGTFRSITDEPVRETRYVDRSVDLTKPAAVEDVLEERPWADESLDRSGRPYPWAVYAYRVRAVNRWGIRGGPSAAQFTIPSAPLWVFSREDGATCHLRWKANPESSLRGYRVYRMDGRFDDAAIRRLTEQPITATEFSDPEAGHRTRRYYVVAVDPLGQEGHPSAPVWYQREWQALYEPFVGPWHQ